MTLRATFFQAVALLAVAWPLTACAPRMPAQAGSAVAPVVAHAPPSINAGKLPWDAPHLPAASAPGSGAGLSATGAYEPAT